MYEAKGITHGDVTWNSNDKNRREYSVNDSDIPVDPEIWSLIERFLLLRAQYRPHKAHQLQWTKVYAESNNRLKYTLSAISSIDKEGGHNAPLMLKPSASSLTPRTPLFGTNGRSGSITPSLSLTPVSSNRNNATKPTVYYNNRVGKVAATLPAWNFIHQMLHRRCRQSMQSCTSFRSQPFLTTILKEAEMRCILLKKTLHFHNSTQQQNHHHSNRHGNKRRKLEPVPELRPAATSTSSLGNIFTTKYSNASLEIRHDADANDDEHEDFTTRAHMKFHLWACLLSSVKEIVFDRSSQV